MTLPAPGERFTAAPIRKSDPSGLGGSGRVTQGGQPVLEMTGADMREVALVSGGASGDATLTCVDDNTLTVSAGGIVQTYDRVE